jgi:hypothetical protein
VNAAEVGVVLLVAAEAPQAYSAFLPSIMTIRTFVGDPGAVADIREGELFGSAFVLLIGAAGSYLTGSSGPMLIGLVTIIVMVGIYEYALLGRRGNTDMRAGANDAGIPAG